MVQAVESLISDYVKRRNINLSLDEKINSSILDLLEKSNECWYTLDDLNKYVNSEETLLDYIRDTEKEFHLECKRLEDLSEEDLNRYVQKLDSLWR